MPVALEKPPDDDWDGVKRNFQTIEREWDQSPIQTRIFNSVNQSINNTTLTALTFDSERFDTGNLHSTVTNPSRITISTTGLYLLGANITWASNVTGLRFLEIVVNNTSSICTQGVSPATPIGETTRLNVSAIWRATANDFFEVVVYQSSGGALNVLAGTSITDISPDFWITRLGKF